MARQPRQQRIDVYGGFTPTGVDRTAGDKMRALAGLGQTMQEATLAIGKPIIEAKRAEEGAQAVEEGAGKIDPQTGEVLETPEIAAYKFGASQYKQAAQQALAEKGRNAAAAYESAFRTDTTKAIEQAKIDYKDDPVGFQNWSKSFTDGSLSKINDPAMKAQANEYIVNRTFEHQLKLQDAFDTKLLNEQIATITTEASDAFDQAKKLIVSGDAIGARNEFDTAVTSLQEVARMNKDFDVDSAIESLEREYDSAQFEARVSNTADTGDFVAANKILLDEMDQVPENFSVEQWENTVNKARTALVKQKSLFDSAKEVSTQEDRAFFTNGLTVISSGGDLSSENMVRMGQIAGDNPLLQKQISNATAVAVFSEMPQSQREKVFDNVDPSDPENMELLQGYAVANQNISKSLRADSWGTAIKQNILTEEEQDEFNEFDVTALLTKNLSAEQRAEYQQAYKRNKQIAARLSEHYGYTFAPFNNQQIQAISSAIPEMTPGEKVELADSIGFDPKVASLLSDKGAGLFSMAATIENSNTKRAIFEGEALLKSETVDPFRDTADLMRTTLFDVLGDTLGNEQRGLVYEAAKAYYASTFIGKNIEYNQGDFEDAIEMIAGKVKNARGFKTLPPSYSEGNNDGTVSNLEDFIDDMDLKTFLELGGKADPYTKTLPVIRSDIQFATPEPVTVDSDRNFERMKSSNYRIKADNGKNNYKFVGPGGVVLAGADGNPFIINVSEDRMNAYIGKRNAERTEQYANYLGNDKFARDVMGLFEPEGSPYFEATGAEEFTSAGEFAKELFTFGLVKGERVNDENSDQGMTRQDGSAKSPQGYLGQVTRDDGGIMTEYSIGVKINGVETEVPSLVPTLTKKEIETLRTLPEGSDVPKEIQIKAADYAKKRMSEGKDPFFQDEEVFGKNADGTSFRYKG